MPLATPPAPIPPSPALGPMGTLPAAHAPFPGPRGGPAAGTGVTGPGVVGGPVGGAGGGIPTSPVTPPVPPPAPPAPVREKVPRLWRNIRAYQSAPEQGGAANWAAFKNSVKSQQGQPDPSGGTLPGWQKWKREHSGPG